jgi:uncharacterized OB-fold protein
MSIRIFDAPCKTHRRTHSHRVRNDGSEICEIDDTVVAVHKHLATSRKCEYCGTLDVPNLRKCPNCGAPGK